jgi:hypothetical protein
VIGMRAGPVALVVVALAMVAALASSASASFPGRNGRLVYSPKLPFVWYPTYRPAPGPDYAFERGGIFTIRADGTHRRIVSTAPGAMYPKWSRSGRRLAFAAVAGTRTSDYELFVVRADGSHVRRVTRNSVADLSPSWGPGGHALAAVRVPYDSNGEPRPAAAELRLVSLVGEPDRVLARGGILAASWSPRGGLIAYTTGHDLFVVSPHGGRSFRVVHLPDDELAGDLGWAPSGATLFYSDYKQSVCNEVAVCARGVWAIDNVALAARGQYPLWPPQRMTPWRSPALMAVWSPDDRRIAYCTPASYFPRTWDLWNMRSDGAEARRVGEVACPSDWQAKPR